MLTAIMCRQFHYVDGPCLQRIYVPGSPYLKAISVCRQSLYVDDLYMQTISTCRQSLYVAIPIYRQSIYVDLLSGH